MYVQFGCAVWRLALWECCQWKDIGKPVTHLIASYLVWTLRTVLDLYLIVSCPGTKWVGSGDETPVTRAPRVMPFMRMRTSWHITSVRAEVRVIWLRTKREDNMAEGNSSTDASAPDYLKIIADHREELLTAMKATDWVETKNKVYLVVHRGVREVYLIYGNVYHLVCGAVPNKYLLSLSFIHPRYLGYSLA